MKKIYLIITMVLFTISHAAYCVEIKPKYVDVTLKERTDLILDIVPNLGTRLIFPFILGSPTHKPQFNYKLTNQEIFEVTKPEVAANQNTFIINAKEPKNGVDVDGRLYQLFLSVDGYNISILLRVNYDMRKWKSDIHFKIDEKERLALIEREIEYRMAVIQEEAKKARASLDEDARKAAISHVGRLATMNPSKKSIKEEFHFTLDNGEKTTIYIDKALNYNDEYYVYLFNFENRSPKDIIVESLLVSDESEDASASLDTVFQCDKSVVKADSVSKCSITSLDFRMIKSRKLKFTVITNRGEVSAKW